MRLDSIPVLGPLFGAGADDHVFDLLLLSGPLIICVIGFLHRSFVSFVLALSYAAGFVAYIGYRYTTMS